MENPDRIKESITLRGICAAIQSMAMPSFENLRQFLLKYGYSLKKINP